MNRKAEIVVAGYYGFGNLGDLVWIVGRDLVQAVAVFDRIEYFAAGGDLGAGQDEVGHWASFRVLMTTHRVWTSVSKGARIGKELVEAMLRRS